MYNQNFEIFFMLQNKAKWFFYSLLNTLIKDNKIYLLID